MTTVAYRAGVIAADSGICTGDMRLGQTRKIGWHDAGGLCGGSGTAPYIAAFIKWFEGGENGDPPKATENAQSFSSAIVVRHGRLSELLVFEPGGSFCIETEYYALGSGREVALGVMWQGGTAVEAVHSALALDKHTWGRCDVRRL